MKTFGKTAVLALFITAGITGSALAQSQAGGSMSSGAMSDKPKASGSMSGSMSHSAMSGSMTGSMDHDKMTGKKKDKNAMTSGSPSGSMSSGSGSMSSQNH